jgi:hypothetical protein
VISKDEFRIDVPGSRATYGIPRLGDAQFCVQTLVLKFLPSISRLSISGCSGSGKIVLLYESEEDVVVPPPA